MLDTFYEIPLKENYHHYKNKFMDFEEIIKILIKITEKCLVYVSLYGSKTIKIKDVIKLCVEFHYDFFLLLL